MSKRDWTTKEVKRLEEMCAAGYTIAEMKEELNRTKDSVKQKMHKMRLNAAHPSRFRNKVYYMYKGDNILCCGSIEEIAEMMEINIRTVMFYLRPSYIKSAGYNAIKLVEVEG